MYEKMIDFFEIWIHTSINTITLLIAILSLAIASGTLFVTIQILKKSQKQFDKNANRSEEMFLTQMSQSDSLNSGLISQIEELQKITNQQLEITEHQLQAQKEFLHEKLMAESPWVIVTNDHVQHAFNKGNKCVSIQLRFKNIGLRTAYDFSFELYLINGDYSGAVVEKVNPTNLEPKTPSRVTLRPEIKPEFEKNFFISHHIIYRDKKLNKAFDDFKFYRFDSKKYQFVESGIDEGKLMRTILNHSK